MLAFLLDENLSPAIARQIAEKRPDIRITSVHHLQGGRYKGQPDEVILVAATQEGLSLVTYDQKTIVPLVVQWGAAGTDHADIVFIDERSIANDNIGALVKALIVLWDASHADAWTNRVGFLRCR